MNITANEIKRQASRIQEQLTKLENTVPTMLADFRAMADIVKSDDSTFSREIILVSETLEKLNEKLHNNFSKLATIMEDYAAETIKNEEEMSKDASAANMGLEDILGTLESMNID